MRRGQPRGPNGLAEPDAPWPIIDRGRSRTMQGIGSCSSDWRMHQSHPVSPEKKWIGPEFYP